jgi:D-3-phosphoglycerate dehydrogenase
MKINSRDSVAVCSRSFSRNEILRDELTNLYANVSFNDAGASLHGDDLVNFLRGHTKAIVALEEINDFVLSRLPNLGVISKYGVGLDKIDLQSLKKFNKRLGWTPGVNRRSVSELVVAFAISLLRGVHESNKEVLSGFWRQYVGGQLTGKTLGIVGCGNVGQDLVHLLKPFNCEILVNDIKDYPDFFAKHSLKRSSIDNLFARADIITLHVPLDEGTRNMIQEPLISLMKPTSFLINIARGGIVDELALKKALLDKKIAGAAFDVFSAEPPADMELLSLPNFLATPHIGGSSIEAVLAMGRSAIDGLDVNSIP